MALAGVCAGCALGRAPNPNGLGGKLDCGTCTLFGPTAAGARVHLTITRPERRIITGAEAIMPICTDDSPASGSLRGPVTARTADPRVATVVQIKRSETSLDVELAAHAPGATRLRVDVGGDRDEFEIRVAEAAALILHCTESEPPHSITNYVELKGLMVGQSATCDLAPLGRLDGSFVDLEPDPHLSITSVEIFEHGRTLRLRGVQPGLAWLRARSGARTLELPFAVVAEGEEATATLARRPLRRGPRDRGRRAARRQSAGRPLPAQTHRRG